jgi:hypothetical protein
MEKYGSTLSYDGNAQDHSPSSSLASDNDYPISGASAVGNQHENLGTDGVHCAIACRRQTQSGAAEEVCTEEQITHTPAARERLKEDHLRLVRVLPGTPASLVQCETRIVPVSKGNIYIALSYAWGLPIAEHVIILDGREHMLPHNLWQFLVTWRSELDKTGTRSGLRWP